MRNQKNTYCFISDDAGKFYKAVQQVNGNYTITKNSQPYPIRYNPINLLNVPFEFATNKEYFSLTRSIVEPLKFVKDGAAILRSFYHLGKGTEHKVFLTVIDWDGIDNIYKLSYNGRIDLMEKKEDPDSGMFTVPIIDDSAWGILSQNDAIEYAIECNERNPKAIRVLFDGMTLLNRYTYQTVQAPIVYNGDIPRTGIWTIPFVKINEDGDSSGIVVKDQTLFYIGDQIPPTNDTQGWFFESGYEILDINIQGGFTFQWNISYTGDLLLLRAGMSLLLYSTAEPGFPLGRTYNLVNRNYLQGHMVNGGIYKFTFNQGGINLSPGGKLFLVITVGETYNTHSNIILTPIVTNILVTAKTTPQPTICYGLRPLDLLQELVSKATNNRYTINSNYFTVNNKSICFPGDSLRSIPNAKIYSSFKDFFGTFNPLNFMALRTIKSGLWMEKAVEVYRQDSTLLDLGEILHIDIEPAKDYFANEIEVGSPNVDLRHPSGRLEFNVPNSFSMPIFSAKRKIELVTKYRMGCFDEQFLILDYQGGSTQDNSGDKTVYVAQISDEKGASLEDIENFENISVDDAPLEPIIKSPRNNDTITFDQPIIKGIVPPGSAVNIYVDTVLDGGTVAGLDGYWEYNISSPLTPFVLGITTGVHVIDATYTDLAAPVSTINVSIDTGVTTSPEITYPTVSNSLYNNLPLIKGVAQNGVNIDISLDGVLITSVVTDNSCKWEYKFVTPITNGNHVISINAGADSVSFNVDSAVSFPLITYIGSELDGFAVINNLPLIKGVALPGTTVELWLNYINFPGSRLNVTPIIADSNGDWSYQVIPVSYLDPISGIPVIIAPIQNGLDIISTSLTVHTVSIQVVGYKLSRPAYNSIQGVIDNTVWNTELSPWRMLRNWFPMFASILAKQGPGNIVFQTSKKNSNLRTVLGTEVIAENDNALISSLGTPIALLEYANIKVRTTKTFAKLLEDFNKGGIVKFSSRGTDLFCLPIGSMKMNSLHSDVQEWKLLMSPLTTYSSLLSLYKNGTLINLLSNTMFHSDYNSLHFVRYNYSLPAKFKVKDMYDDWFNNRNSQWILNPDYIQKFETGNVIRDQVITNGVSNIILRIYRCFDAFLVDEILYNPVNPAPINTPEIVLEAIIDWSLYPESQYFGVWFAGTTPVGIFERVETRTTWPGTILIEAWSSLNKVGFFFSTGARTIILVEGLVKKQQSDFDIILSKDQNRNTKTLYSEIGRYRYIRFGTAYGLPDYLYMKIKSGLILDNVSIEGVLYTLAEGEKIEPSEDVDGHPLYYYTVKMDFQDNPLGVTIGGVPDENQQSVIIVLDGEAIGLPVGQITRIELNNE